MKRILSVTLSLAMTVLVLATGCGKNDNDLKNEAVKLDKSNIEIAMGKTEEITVENYAGEAQWQSDNEAVATVSDKGLVTAVSTGTTVVNVMLDEKSELNCMVTVVPGESKVQSIKVSGIYSSANDITASYTQSATVQLKATCEPYDPDEKLIWKSSDETKATVDSNGLVSLWGNGEVTVTAAAYNGVEGKCIVRVKNVPSDVKNNNATAANTESDNSASEIGKTDNNAVSGTFASNVPQSLKSAKSAIVISDRYLYLGVGKGYTLTCAIANADSDECEWMSSDKSVAIVNKDGCVVAIGNGEATISAVTSDGAVAHCRVAVGDEAIGRLKDEADK